MYARNLLGDRLEEISSKTGDVAMRHTASSLNAHDMRMPSQQQVAE